ncbi:MAG: Hsp20/alpha crystallin family protein [Candidatus Lokiarchaeota archaeon]|nr:Hsp20/alpha crystallin family protein [Candidatus Lokiarchaeota archaeon]
MGKKRKPFRPFDDDDDDSGTDDDEGSPFGDVPDDFFDQFQDIFKNLMKQFKSKDFVNFSKNIFKQIGLPNPDGSTPDDPGKGKPEVKGPFVYGFSVRIGPDGKPIINKFGDIKLAPQPAAEEEANDAVPVPEPGMIVRQPVSDVINEDKEIVVVVELPGVEKEDIKLDATDYSIEISADAQGKRKYQTRLDLPAKINPDHAKARYTNGILEVRLQKVGEKARRSSSIPID